MEHRIVAVVAGVALATLACARSRDPASATCLHVLQRRLPEAQVLSVAAERGRQAAVDYRLGEDGTARRLTCAVERRGSEGGWRVRAASLDGVPLTDTELAVVNADLFLTELARAGAP